MNNLKTSSTGLNHLKTMEAFMSKLYNDGPNKKTGHCTIGYGHLVHYNHCNVKKYVSEHKYINGISIKQATVILQKDLSIAEKGINKLVTLTLNQNQFDALVSLVFNIGVGAFSSSTLLKVINNNQLNNVPAAFQMWKKTSGKISAGLINRRESENRLFQK